MIRSRKNKKYGYCKLYKKEVNIFCKCTDIEYKSKKEIKKRTSKQNKIERSRKNSLFTNNMNVCYICKKPKEHTHEVFFGSNRLNSIRYKLIVPLCDKCHSEMHKNSKLQDEFHKLGQILFEKEYSNLNFVDIFYKNYL